MKHFAILFIISSLISINLEAANRYWVAPSSGNWNNTANWSTKSGGASGASVPGINDRAIFDQKSSSNCSIDMNVAVKGIFIDDKFAGQILQSNYSISVGKDDFKMEGGTFIGGTKNIEVEDNFIIKGGAFTSTSATLSLAGSFDHKGGTFNHNFGKIEFIGTSDQNFKVKSPAPDFNTVKIAMNMVKKLKIANNDTLKVLSNLQCIFGKTNGGDIAIYDSLDVKATWFNGSSRINLLGSGTTNMILNSNCWDIDDVNIDKQNSTDSIIFSDGDGDGHIEMGNTNKWLKVKKGVLGFEEGTTVNLKFKELTIEPNGSFISENTEIALQGNFINNGGKFIHTNSTFRFNGNNHRIIDLSTSSSNKFDNVIVDMAPNKNLIITTGDTLFVQKNLTLKSGKTKNGIIMLSGDAEVNNGYDGGTASLVFAGDNEQNFNLNNAEHKFQGNVIINKSNAGNVNLTSDFIMQTNGQELDLQSGILVTNTSTSFTMGNNVTWKNGNDSSYVKGPMKKIGNQPFAFPVGDDNFFAPIAISKPSKPSDGFQAEYIKGDAGTYYDVNSKDFTIDHISSAEYWTLNRIAGNSNVTLNLSWEEGRSGEVTDMNEMMVVRWDGSQNMWKDHGNGGTSGNIVKGKITTLGTTGSFGPFTFASTSASNPLPIELAEMDVDYSNGKADIYWMTATETNNDYFEVEKKVDGGKWNVIRKVQGAGNSIVYTHYSIVDKDVSEGVNSYRLKQVDYNGKFEYFKPVSVNVVFFQSTNTLFAYPNPTANTISLRSETESLDKIRIYNSAGIEVFPSAQMKNGELVVDLKTFPSGIYLMKSPTGDYVRVFKSNSIKKF